LDANIVASGIILLAVSAGSLTVGALLFGWLLHRLLALVMKRGAASRMLAVAIAWVINAQLVWRYSPFDPDKMPTLALSLMLTAAAVWARGRLP
jgi:hypothetical protein